MTHEELLRLIPLYVADTLDPREKEAVEREIPHSRELQEELAFWRRARQATVSYAEYLQQGHPTADQLVDYVELSQAGQQSHLIHKHLKECKSCRMELELISKSYPANPASHLSPTEMEKPTTYFDRLHRCFSP